MKARYFLFALALAPVASAAAQEPSGRIVERYRSVGPQGSAQAWVFGRRARLGVTVATRAAETDSLGARIETVTPGGPADRAGLRSGDVITRLDGTSLVANPQRNRIPEGTSFAGIRLIELAAKLAPNDTVAVEYLRGKDRRTARIVTAEEPENMLFRTLPDGGGYVYGEPGMVERQVLPRMREGVELTSPNFRMFFGSSLLDLELAPLNEDLGQYFGTSEGVLVIRTPKRGQLGLKGGDVITAVDGRKATNPSQLMRILRSYDAKETVKFDILRNRKRETVTGRLDEAGEVRGD